MAKKKTVSVDTYERAKRAFKVTSEDLRKSVRVSEEAGAQATQELVAERAARAEQIQRIKKAAGEDSVYVRGLERQVATAQGLLAATLRFLPDEGASARVRTDVKAFVLNPTRALNGFSAGMTKVEDAIYMSAFVNLSAQQVAEGVSPTKAGN